MAVTPPLSLSDIVDISVTVAPSAASANPFNQGLFIGNSNVIPSYGANSRVRPYTSLSAVLSDGFTTSSPEYLAAQVFFSQIPVAHTLWLGRQDATAAGTATITAGHAGTGWAVGDTFTLAGGSNFLGQVLTAPAGVVGTFAILQGGTGYTVATGVVATAVAPSVGTGLQLSVATLGETLLQSAIACRAASQSWYGLTVYNPTDADNLALAQWADPLWETTRFYVWSASAGIPAATPANIALQLQTLKLRVVGIYATTQAGLYPNNIYAAVGLMGVEMGYNTGLANSFFTIAHKSIVGISVEPLKQGEYQNIKNASFNVYGNFAPFQLLEPGFLSNGSPSYLWLNLAMLVNNLQIQEMNVLASNPAVPQTNAGEQLLIDAANSACANARNIGFLADGTWRGVPVLHLSTGDPVPGGYLNQSQPYAQQLAGDRAAGKAMPIYCCITTAGVVLSLVIGVYTQL